ncbi:MAG: helix-turn-helix domain-containing protein [Bacteroidaceae bacterium]|nr:helix-turn-helix domain-containing protein [Bacteroidaceae bacterium]
MIAYILYFIPSLLCMMWTAMYMTKKKNATQKMMQTMMFLGSFHYATQAIYISPNTNYKLLCMLDIIEPPLLLTMLSFLLLYIHRHATKKDASESKKIRILLPAMIFAPLLFAMYYMFGIDNAMTYFKMSDQQQVHVFTEEMVQQFPTPTDTTVLKAFELVDIIIFNILAGLYCLKIIARCIYTSFKNGYKFGDLTRFWTGRGEIPFVRAAAFCVVFLILTTSPPMFVGRSYIVNHPIVGILMSLFTTIAIFFFAYIETNSSEKTLTLKKCVSKAFSEVSVIEVESMNENDNKKEDRETLAIIRTRSLTEKIRVAFEEEKIYKDPELSLAIMAEKFHVNRTTLSNTINQQYGMSFREMLSNYRINAAKEYLLQNPSATQLEIAMECGFKSASAFNHKFKELTGETPNSWLLKN